MSEPYDRVGAYLNEQAALKLISPDVRDALMASLDALRQAIPTLPAPDAAQHMLVWDNGPHHFEIEANGGMMEYFYLNRETGMTWELDLDLTADPTPDVITMLESIF